jgi:cellulose synthase/poly-beta-1,6-N-acetylglucosamine synthase-like glycosyltransferase
VNSLRKKLLNWKAFQNKPFLNLSKVFTESSEANGKRCLALTIQRIDPSCLNGESKMISVCIPSWNSLEYLKIVIPSLKKNTRMPYEIIVHDNGSTDGTESWLADNGISYTKSGTNKGFCGVNEALRKAKYKNCIIFNSDMYSLPRLGLRCCESNQQVQKVGH